MAKKIFIGDDGKEYEVVEKLPFYKKKWFIVVAVLLILASFSSLLGGKNDNKEAEKVEVTETETEKEKDIVEKDELESASLVGEIYKKDNVHWTEEFIFVDKEGNKYQVISNDDVPEKYMHDGLIYRVIGEKEENKIILNDYEVLADNWKSYEKKQRKEEEIKDIEKTIKDRVLGEYYDTVIKQIDINENLGTDDENDYIVLTHLKWNVTNKPKTTRGMLELYSDDLAATLAKHASITELTIFWEVPHHLEGNNIAKMHYSKSGDRMAIGERWYDPLIRE